MTMKDQAHTLRAIMAETPAEEITPPGELLIFVVNDLADKNRMSEILAHLSEACRGLVGVNLSYVGHLPLQMAGSLLKSNSEPDENSAAGTQGRVMRNRISSE